MSAKTLPAKTELQTKTNSNGLLLGLLFMGVLMAALDIAIAGPALPAMQASFGVDDRAITWVFTLYVLLNLISTPLMAKLSDLFGRRTIYVLDVSLFALGSLLVAVAPNFAVVLVGRAVQGLGAGGIFPVASAVIGDTFPPEKRGGALGLIGAVFGLAFIIGPIVGGLLLTLGWHWLFLVNLPIALVIIVAGLYVLPATRRTERPYFDWPGMGLLALLLTTLIYGLNRIDTSRFFASLTVPDMLAYLVAIPLLLALFILVERRAPDPVIRLSLFASRQVVLALFFAAGAGLGEASFVFVPKLLTQTYNVSSSSASFMLLPLVLAMAVGSPLAGRVLDKKGSRLVLLIGNVLLGTGMFSWGLFSTNLALFFGGSVQLGLALGILLGAPLRYIMLGEAASTERASAQGALTLFTSLGQLIGAAAMGAVIASQGNGLGGYESAFNINGGLSLLLIAATFLLKPRAEELAAYQAKSDI